MRDLPHELPRPAAAASADELVGAEGDEAPRRLACREPSGACPQVAQKEVHGLARVADPASGISNDVSIVGSSVRADVDGRIREHP